ncbi:MAG: RNA pseudouridine synthase, partial [Christensenellaceae bacterium]|nr:RNA pseudouridine synthase [Christensenellaceae bacterium]
VDYIIKDAKGAKVRVVHQPTRDGMPAVTRYYTEKTNGELSLLDVELVTGRTHQARAHLASAGSPILGDDKYGDRRANKKFGARYQALWSYKIIFETGVNNCLEYLNKKVIETDNIVFPYVDFENGPQH